MSPIDLSDGTRLPLGQFITMSALGFSRDPEFTQTLTNSMVCASTEEAMNSRISNVPTIDSPG